MSDKSTVVESSDPPPPPSGPRTRPRITTLGRSTAPTSTSNSDNSDMPELEYFGMPGPRGYPPLTEFLDIHDTDLKPGAHEQNRRLHHTSDFSLDSLVVRRGQEFQVQVTFNRPYKPAEDKFALEFVIGSSPQYSKGTYIPVFPTPDRQTSWSGRVVEMSQNVLTMGVTPAANCIVGQYHMYVAIVTPYGIRRTRRDNSRDIYILFNPWAADDEVFLDDEREREECVMTELGIIYHGSYDDIAERTWNYGQFNYGILDACLYILDKCQMPISNRGDPVKVVRQASAMLNSRDDEGVLVGNWSGNYMDGVAPTSWTGSTDILLSYYRSRTPVAYAQCWVYAAVFNTFLRCLGIPSRVVTNFFSAHDNDGNLKTDIILDENGRIDRSRTRDSIWNYHCWNECYMSRKDLPAGFGGWQVVDATPQETSDGLYRCGPASVQAIKHGHTCFPYDAPFVFAEVNSDVVFNVRSKDGTLEPVKVNRTHVGRLVLTKNPGDTTRRDITDQYKFPEGSAEERTVLEKAVTYGCKREQSNPPPADVELNIPTLDVLTGDDFQLTLEFVNNTDQTRTVDAYISGSVVFYTGVTSSEFLFRTPTVTVEPHKCVKEILDIEARTYMRHLVEQSNLNFIITGRVKETQQIVSAMKVITLKNPQVTIEVSENGKVNEQMLATVKFTNPFTFDLEEVYVRMEGPGLMTAATRYYSLIPGQASLLWSEYFTPQRVGLSRLMVVLDCAALRQVYGEKSINIQP